MVAMFGHRFDSGRLHLKTRLVSIGSHLIRMRPFYFISTFRHLLNHWMLLNQECPLITIFIKDSTKKVHS